MITVPDFYKKNAPSISNSKELDISFGRTEVFPEGGLYIGEFTSATGHQAPALIPLQDTSGICFLETDKNKKDIYTTMQIMALRLAASINPRLSKFTLYDPTGLGANLISLARLSQDIKGAQIITEPEALKKELQDIKKSIPETIQNVLGYQFLGKTLMDYNASAIEMARPYRFIFITDFPSSLTDEHQSLIEAIVRNGKQAGIFVFLGLDTTARIEKSYHSCEPMKLLDLMTVIYPAGGRYYIKNIPHEKFYNKFRLELSSQLPSPDILESLVEGVNNRLKDDTASKVELSDILTEANMWTRDSGRGIEVPIGKSNARVIQNLRLSTDDGMLDSPHHGVVGGATGSGKTVLLHDIICNAAWLYSPKQLQFVLLDFKEGTEFKVYEDLPHVRILSTRSELEFAKSVFEYLDREITRRGDLFKEKKVSNIARYNEVAEEKLPRILLIIDEFQKLLDGDFRSSSFFGTVLEDFGRRARSFGINMLLSTQSLAGVDFRHAMSQFGLRIVMRLNSTTDCTSFLDNDNFAPYTELTHKGEAIYNARGGLLSGNVLFQAAYMGESRILNLVTRFNDAAAERYGGNPLPERYIYDGAQAGDITHNPDLALYRTLNEKECVLFIGEPCSLSQEHVSTRLSKKKAANIVLVGKDAAAGTALIRHLVEQFLPQSGNSSSVCFLDNTDYDDGNPFTDLSDDARVRQYNDDDAILSQVETLHEEFLARKAKTGTESRMLVILKDVHGIRELRRADRYSPAPKPLQSLLEIIAEGPVHGMHVILSCSTYKGFSDMFEAVVDQFDTRIELSGGEGYRLMKNMDERNAVRRVYQANVLLPRKDDSIRIKLYK